MAAVFGVTAVSADGGEVLGGQPISTDNSGHYSPANVELRCRRKDRNFAWCMAGTICLVTTIFLLLRGHQCLRVLESLSNLAGGAKGRLLSVAETGYFRRCVEAGVNGELGAAGGAHWEASGSGSHSSSTASSASAPNGHPSDYSGGASSGAVGGSDHAPGPAMHEPEDFEGSLGRTARGLPKANAHEIPLEVLESHDPADDYPWDPYPDFNTLPHPAKRVPLDSPADLSEHSRQYGLLRVPRSVRRELTQLEKQGLQEAERMLLSALDEKANLLGALRRNAEVQTRVLERLRTVMSESSSFYWEERQRLHRRLIALNREARSLQYKLYVLRHNLINLVPRKQHLALSLRVSAGRLASGNPISPRGAAAISAALLILRGSASSHFVAKPAEEDAIFQLCENLLTRIQESTAALRENLEAPVPASAWGCSSLCRRVWRRRIRKQRQKCESLHKEASTFILQLRHVLMSSPQTDMVEELEKANLQLLKTMDQCASV